MTEPAPWTRIYARIKAQIPAAPDAVIRQEVWSVMIDFTADTNMWIEEVPLAIQPNVITYPVTLTHGVANRLMLVWNNDPSNPSSSYRWADSGITMRVPGVIKLFNIPTQAKSWTAAIAKVVSDGRLVSTVLTGYPEVDDWIVDMNSDIIYYGTMYFLQRQPAKPYGNKDAAKENGQIYESQKSTARVNNLHTNVFGGQAWQYPQNFATISRKGWT
jgi:hypothetical protein